MAQREADKSLAPFEAMLPPVYHRAGYDEAPQTFLERATTPTSRQLAILDEVVSMKKDVHINAIDSRGQVRTNYGVEWSLTILFLFVFVFGHSVDTP